MLLLQYQIRKGDDWTTYITFPARTGIETAMKRLVELREKGFKHRQRIVRVG